jgi:tetratricopeptide (TPR) repeat protein
MMVVSGDQNNESMNWGNVSSRLRLILLLLSLITILGIVALVSPRLLGLYYQIQGGKIIEGVEDKMQASVQKSFSCTLGPTNDARTINQINAAILDLQESIQYNPKLSQSHLLLARAHCLLGNYDNAVKSYGIYTQLKPDNPLGYLEMGFAYEALGKDQLAVENWKSAGVDARSFWFRGEEARDEGDYDGALKWYERGIMVGPEITDLWYGIGLANGSLREWGEALSAYKRAIQLAPNDPRAYYAAGEILLTKLDKADEAIEIYEAASEVDPVPVEAFVGLGNAYKKANLLEDSLMFYEKAIDLGKSRGSESREDRWKKIWPYYLLGELYLQAGRLDEALTSFDHALALDEKEEWIGWSLWGRGRVALQKRDFVGAEADFQKVLDIEKNTYLQSQSYLGLGRIHIQKGEMDKGIDYLRLAHRIHPENQGLHLYLADELFEAGQFKSAVLEYEDYLSHWPNDFGAKESLAEALKLLEHDR